MILNPVTDWVFNFYWDSFNRIFIYVIDNILYSLMGFIYKVFLIIGTFDLFGGYTSHTESAMEIYQAFSKRIYGVLGIIVMFILAYQIILFVIDPDKGLKESKKLVTNIVKAIILTIIAPLVFHYMAQIQYHVLVSDNLIWNIVLGEGASHSDNVIESGNTMASMLFISVFHPLGTQYSDFYTTDGTLRPPGNSSESQACYYYQGGDMSQDTIARTFATVGTGAAIGWIIGGPIGAGIGGAIGGLVGWMSDAENAVSTCDFYYWILYQGGISPDKVQEVKPNEVTNITNYAESTVGYSNKAGVLAPNTALIDEIAQENNMEYYYFSPVGAAAIVFFLIAYTLDIAVRAFKLAFLQMIAPIPILLGAIPKNEKMYSTWKDQYIKTYLDVFVRVFVMAFIALMIKLLPAFVDAMMGAFEGISAADQGNRMLKGVTFFALVIGLVRASKEIPELIKDLAKNAGGLLSGINLNPLDSYKKSSKPIGAMAGAGLGATAGAFNAFKRSKGKNLRGRFRDTVSGTTRGLVSGGVSGYKNGFGRGAVSKTLNDSYASVRNGIARRDAIESALKQGRVKDALDYMSKGKMSDFRGSFFGDTEGNKQYFDAATNFDKVANAGKSLYSSGVDALKNSLNDEKSAALNDNVTYGDAGVLRVANQSYEAANLQQAITKACGAIQQEVFTKGKTNSDGSMSFEYNGQTYNSRDGSTNSIRAIKDQIRNDIQKDVNLASQSEFEKIGTSTFAGRTFTGTYDERKKAMTKYVDNAVKEKEISNLLKAYNGASGVEIAKQLSKQQRDVYMQNSDLLNENQRRDISNKLNKSISDTSLLKNILDIKPSDAGNISSVMTKIAETSWEEKVAALSKEQQSTFYKELAGVQRDMTKSMADIATDAKRLKDASSSLERNRLTGKTVNSLADGGPKKSDKK